MFLKRIEIDMNDHLFGRAHKSIESCQNGEFSVLLIFLRRPKELVVIHKSCFLHIHKERLNIKTFEIR